MVHLPKKSEAQPESRYDSLGLTNLPFPPEPVANPYSHDPRLNGSIYAEEPVRAEIEAFEKLLIDPEDFPNRATLAYLWSKGDQESGRGMGKTALLRYFRHRINRDWGATEFHGAFSAVVVYVAFPAQINRRYMEQLAWSALVDICRNGVLRDSRAALRLEELGTETASAVMREEDGSENAERLLDDEVLLANGVEPEVLDARIAERLHQDGIGATVASKLAQGRFEDHLRSLRRDHNLEPFYVPRDLLGLDYARALLFNDVVLYLRAAGFAGGYLFIDDIENLVDQMARKARIQFAKDFALCTVRPGYANTSYKFFSCVLTTHQQASVGLSQAWGDAGLNAMARLDPASPNSVELPLPSKQQARAIIVAHLDFFRKDRHLAGSIAPFTQEGIDALLENQQMLHPRVMLSNAANVVMEAARQGRSQIDADLVRTVMTAPLSVATPDFSDNIEDAV